MTLFVLVFAGLLGAIVGSFLNVVIWRLPRGESVIRPRSRCPECGKPISALDNIPVLSWVLLRGRCRGCKSPIAVRYPLVELLTAGLFVAAAWRWIDHLPTAGLVAAALAALLAISFIDWDHKFIPDKISKPGIVLAIAFAPISVGEGRLHPAGWIEGVTPARGAWLHAGAGAITGAAIVYLIGVVGRWLTRQEAMGLGDVKLLAFIGGLTGPIGVVYALILASFAGAIIGLIRLFLAFRKPLGFPLEVTWDGGRAELEEAWVKVPRIPFRVQPQRLVFVAPEPGDPPQEAGFRMSLQADDVLEDEDVELRLKGALEGVETRGGERAWIYRIVDPSDEDSLRFRVFAKLRHQVPFGPFLAIGGACTLFFRDDVHWLIVEGYPTWVRSLFS